MLKKNSLLFFLFIYLHITTAFSQNNLFEELPPTQIATLYCPEPSKPSEMELIQDSLGFDQPGAKVVFNKEPAIAGSLVQFMYGRAAHTHQIRCIYGHSPHRLMFIYNLSYEQTRGVELSENCSGTGDPRSCHISYERYQQFRCPDPNPVKNNFRPSPTSFDWIAHNPIIGYPLSDLIVCPLSTKKTNNSFVCGTHGPLNNKPNYDPGNTVPSKRTWGFIRREATTGAIFFDQQKNKLYCTYDVGDRQDRSAYMEVTVDITPYNRKCYYENRMPGKVKECSGLKEEDCILICPPAAPGEIELFIKHENREVLKCNFTSESSRGQCGTKSAQIERKGQNRFDIIVHEDERRWALIKGKPQIFTSEDSSRYQYHYIGDAIDDLQRGVPVKGLKWDVRALNNTT